MHIGYLILPYQMEQVSTKFILKDINRHYEEEIRLLFPDGAHNYLNKTFTRNFNFNECNKT